MIKKITLTLMLIFIFVIPITSSYNNQITKIKRFAALGSKLERLLLSKNFNMNLDYCIATISEIDYVVLNLGSDYRQPLFELELAEDETRPTILFHSSTSLHYQIICPRAEVDSSAHTPQYSPTHQARKDQEEKSPINISGETRHTHNCNDKKCRHDYPFFLLPEPSTSTIAAVISGRSSTDSFVHRSSTDSFEPLNKG